MPRPRQHLTFREALDLIIKAKVVDGAWAAGTNFTKTEISLPAGGIDADKNGFFKRSDLCRLIGYVQMLRRDTR